MNVWDLVDRLGPEQARSLVSMGVRRNYPRGEVIFHEGDLGDTFHLVRRGRIAVQVASTSGDLATVNVLGPGDCFGELTVLFPDERRSATARAMEAVETLALHSPQLNELRRQNPVVDRFLVEVLAERVRALSQQVSESLHLPATKRLMRRLIEAAETWEVDHDGGVLPLAQRDLAAMAGVTRPTVNRELRAAEEKGLVELSRNRVTILDVAGLRRLAG